MREEKSGGALVASHAYTYDNNGNKHTDVASKANADVAGAYLESTTTYSYDPADRLAESVKTGSGAGTETYVHDDNANVISQDVGGTATTYSYDRNRLLTDTADGSTVSYRYDPFGRQTSVVAAGLTISRTTYDGFDHIAESEQMNYAGVLESTTYAYDPLDRTASKTADGETTDYTYLGLSSEVLGEEVAGELTKSYQYSPWGQRLSQITHQADPEQGVEAGESAFYGYNAHTDVETLTDDTGNTVATYGYTAYGNADDAEFTGIDKPDPANPERAKPYNAYRYNAKRWDAASGTYDMGFRDYSPGLNRFTTRDMYNGALADMGLGTDPYTSNRYAFTAGNPISGIELDGHRFEPATFASDLWANTVNSVTGTVDWAGRFGSSFGGCISDKNADRDAGSYASCDQADAIGEEASLENIYLGAQASVNEGVGEFNNGEYDLAYSAFLGSMVGLALPGNAVKRHNTGNGQITVNGSAGLSAAGRSWLKGSHGNAGRVPPAIREAMGGVSYGSWAEFRGAFWKAVAGNDELAGQFSKSNRAQMAKGNAPFVHSSQTYAGRDRYEIHHITPRSRGGAPYDFNNLVVVTPKFHSQILDTRYHYGARPV